MKRPKTSGFQSDKRTILEPADRRILAILQRDSSISNLELAKRTNLSPPTCLRRVRRLRERGIILRDVSLIDPAKVGKGLTVFVEVALERQQDRMQRAFEDMVRATPEILQCYVASGDCDFLLVVQISTMESYHDFVKRVLARNHNIRNFRSTFAMKTIKNDTSITLD